MKSRMSSRKYTEPTEHLHEPMQRLYAIERLIQAAADAEVYGDPHGNSLFDDMDAEERSDFLQGVRHIIGDVRRELNALTYWDIEAPHGYEPADPQTAAEREAAELHALTQRDVR